MDTSIIIISIFSLVVLIISVIIHELAHGYVASSLGDLTAKYEGRLTLNPLKHLDPFGSVILPLLLFISGSPVLVGWAKPVPINPYNFRDQKWGSLKVAIAGPLSNIALALFFGLIIRFVLVPYGFYDFFTRHTSAGDFNLFSYIVGLNIILAIFNLVPIPPLDGSWILFSFLSQKFDKAKMFLQQYGVFILIFFIFFGGLQRLSQVTQFLYYLISGS